MDQPRDIRVDAPEPDALGQVAGSASDLSDVPERSRHAVIIGIDRYQDDRIPNLHCARADAEAVYGVLTDPCLGRFPPDNVTLLLDENATERKIRSALGTDLPRRAGSQDTVLVYYAGHGAPVIDPTGKSRDGMEKYLVPTDAVLNDLRSTAIAMESIQKFFGWLEASQVLFFIDSCYSGMAGGRTFERDDYKPRASLTNDFLDDLGSEGRLVVTACDVNEVSLEVAALGHGLFTYYLTKGLKGAADQNGDGLVTAQELYEYVHKNVSQHAKSLDGRMNPIQKGSVRGRVVLTRYETEAQRQARTLGAEAEGRERAGDLVKALELWIRVTQLDPAHRLARQRVEEIRQRHEDEERATRERVERIREKLFTLYWRGELPAVEYNEAIEAIGKEAGTRTEVETRFRHFVEALADGQISTKTYLVSIEHAKAQRDPPAAALAEALSGLPTPAAPTPSQARVDAPAPTDSPPGPSPAPDPEVRQESPTGSPRPTGVPATPAPPSARVAKEAQIWGRGTLVSVVAAVGVGLLLLVLVRQSGRIQEQAVIRVSDSLRNLQMVLADTGAHAPSPKNSKKQGAKPFSTPQPAAAPPSSGAPSAGPKPSSASKQHTGPLPQQADAENPVAAKITGTWRSATDTFNVYSIVATGSTVSITELNVDKHQVGSGQGKLIGRGFEMDYVMNFTLGNGPVVARGKLSLELSQDEHRLVGQFVLSSGSNPTVPVEWVRN